MPQGVQGGATSAQYIEAEEAPRSVIGRRFRKSHARRLRRTAVFAALVLLDSR